MRQDFYTLTSWRSLRNASGCTAHFYWHAQARPGLAEGLKEETQPDEGQTEVGSEDDAARQFLFFLTPNNSLAILTNL